MSSRLSSMLLAIGYMTPKHMTPNRQACAAGLLALLMFVISTDNTSFIGFDSRFVLFAKEMWRYGPSLFPTTYGEYYPDYPGTSTLLTYLLSLPFGEINKLTAWLPTAIASAITIGLTYRIVVEYSLRWALLSVALLLLSNAFISEARAVSLDQMVSAISLTVFYRVHTADRYPVRAQHVWLAALLVLGFVIRGPLGLVVPAGVACSYYLLDGQWRRLFIFGLLALLLLISCTLLLLGLAYVSGGAEFMQEVLHMQVIGRIDGSAGASAPYYYFTSSMGNYALAYPVALLVLLLLVIPQWWNSNDSLPSDPSMRLVWFCAIAGLTVMLGLSIPQAKKARYILPMAPMAAIIAAYPFQIIGGRAASWIRFLLQAVWLLLPLLLIIFIAANIMSARFLKKYGNAFEWNFDIALILGFLFALQIAALVFFCKARIRPVGLAMCAVLSIWGSYILILEPIKYKMYNTRDFTLEADVLIARNPAPLVFYGWGKDAKTIKYLVNLDHGLQPLFLDQPEQLQKLSGAFYVMTDRTRYEALQEQSSEIPAPVLDGSFDKTATVLLFFPSVPSP